MATTMRADRFIYEDYEIDASGRRVVCNYSLGPHRFTEEIRFGVPANADDEAGAWDSPAVDAAARILFLLAGVSYYKTVAPPVVDLGSTATTEDERAFLRDFYVEGLGEFAYRNGVDLTGIEVAGPEAGERRLAGTALRPGHPLVPFGGGIDSIVTVDHVARRDVEPSLFVVSRSGDRYAAIEEAAAVTGLPVARAERRVDPAVLRSEELGFLNGHVPVTGIILAIALVTAVLDGHDAVVMANERSASVPTLWDGDRAINHQWSKSAAFEAAFRRLLAGSFAPAPECFSILRARSELWVAREFSGLDRFHRAFRSCNRAFAIDPARRLDHWCGTCDKCCFIDLVLSPYLEAQELNAIFGGNEPLTNDSMYEKFRALVGTGDGPKPFECVGDEEECRAAAVLAADRPDRSGTTRLALLAAEVRAATAVWRTGASLHAAVDRLLSPEGADFVPPRFREGAPQRVR